MDAFRVIGTCEVAETAPGDTISRKKLEAEGANIDALIQGGHLEPTKSEAKSDAKAKTGSDGGA